MTRLITFPAPLEWDYSTKVPRQAELTKDLNDCTASDLEYLINWRKTITEITGVEHCAECLDETRHFEMIAKGMRALGISTVRDIPDGMTFEEMMTAHLNDRDVAPDNEI